MWLWSGDELRSRSPSSSIRRSINMNGSSPIRGSE